MFMDGILIVDKPQGITSHDVVNLIRRQFVLKKVGHGGTLDPMATGVLVMLLGKATKSSQTFLNDDKEYEATMVLGATSDTGDAWGRITPSGIMTNPDERKIKSTFDEFLGETEQAPPMYSAVKIRGKKLYQLARKGISVDVAPKKIFIKALEILNISLPEISFKVTCSKGTYIRKLASDIGDRLKTGAYLSSLRRTRSGKFTVENAILGSDIKNLRKEDIEKRLVQP